MADTTAETPAEVCDFRRLSFGVEVEDCGQPATTSVVWECPHGHAEVAPACDEHVELLADAPLWCAACAEDDQWTLVGEWTTGKPGGAT